MNSEYLSFVDNIFETTGRSSVPDRKKIRVLELGCGSGPLGSHLLDLGYSVDFSDYSEILVKRLTSEFGYTAFAADCSNLSMVDNETYDVVLLAGVVYESDDYSFPSRIYAEVNRVLKPHGVFIHFLNTYKSVLCGIRFSPIILFLEKLKRVNSSITRPIVMLKKNSLIRRCFGKAPIQKSVHNWQYHPDDIVEMLSANNFEMEKIKPLGIEAGMFQFVPFFTKLIDNSEFTEKYGIKDILFSCRNEILPHPVIRIADFIRSHWPHLCARYLAIMAVKQ